MRLLKIIIFEGSLHPPVFIKRMIDALAEKGHEIYLLYFGAHECSHRQNLHYIPLGSSKNKLHLILQSFQLGLKSEHSSVSDIIKLIIRGNGKNLQINNLKLLLEEIKPDLVHVQWPALLDIMEDVLKQQKVPVILSQRGYQVNVKPFVNKEYFEKLAKFYPNVTAFHSVSKAISIRGDKIHASPHKIDEVVYTGIELHKFNYREKYNRNKKLKILCVGRPHWKKGLHDAVLACGRLQDLKVDHELTIVGGKGNEEILFLTHKLGIEKNVIILDKVPKEKVYELMCNCDLLVVSSIEEGIPNVLVEAMALGVPVLSTACGGVEELITHGKDGWVVPARDPKALAAQLQVFSCTSHNSIESMREAARKKVEQQHSKEKMLEGMEMLYNKVIGTATL